MAREPHRRHSDKMLVHSLSGNAQSIMNWGIRIVSVLGGSTFLSWIIGNVTQHPGAMLGVDKFLWQGCVILYFTSWITGVTRDKTNQEKVYAGAPRQLKITGVGVMYIVVIFILFALMFVAVGFAIAAQNTMPPFPFYLIASIRPKQGVIMFVLFLNILWLSNAIIWQYYVRKYINPIEHRSQAIYREDHDYIGLIKVRIIGDYIKGNWQWYRYTIGGLLLVGCDTIVWRWRASNDVNFAVVLSLAVFLAVIESWIWSMRLKVDYSIGCVDEIAHHYQLVPQEVSDEG